MLRKTSKEKEVNLRKKIGNLSYVSPQEIKGLLTFFTFPYFLSFVNIIWAWVIDNFPKVRRNRNKVFRNLLDASRYQDLRAFFPGLEMFSKFKIHRKFDITDWIKLFLSEYFRVNISQTYISVVFQWKNMLWDIAEIISLKFFFDWDSSFQNLSTTGTWSQKVEKHCFNQKLRINIQILINCHFLSETLIMNIC